MEKIKSKELPERKDIPETYKWKLDDIYPTDDGWEKDFTRINEMIPEISNFGTKLKTSLEGLLECLQLRDNILSKSEKLYTYARMRRDEDNSNSNYQALTDRATSLLTDIYAAISFIEPLIVSISEDRLKTYIENNPKAKIYFHFIADIRREKEHILSHREEEILALVSEVAQAPSEIFNMFNNADIKFPYIKDESGDKVELTKGNYIRHLESNDRSVRKDAYEKLYEVYQQYQNTFASCLSNNLRQTIFFANMRKYNSSLEASLSGDNIQPDVYNNLIKTVEKNLHLFYEYVDIRRKVLKLDKLNMYDIYVPLVKEPLSNIPYEEGCTMVKKALEPLGQDYLVHVQEAFDKGWIDVYENKGKTGGAYSWGNYYTHPYILLNYQGTIKDLFTIAHEMGHAMHTLYTNKTQPYIYSEYKIFVAEVASIVNEFLLMDYMISNAKNEEEEAYLINSMLDDYRGTLFRQTMFAEFEKIIHEKVARKEALTAAELKETYRNLNGKYFGPNVNSDGNIAVEWARIPHFYSPFYVYKYATGFAAAASISEKILNREEGAIDKYLTFLSSGGSDYPLELLKNAGVDLTTPQPIIDATGKYELFLKKLVEMI